MERIQPSGRLLEHPSQERAHVRVHEVSENTTQLPLFTCSQKLLRFGFLGERETASCWCKVVLDTTVHKKMLEDLNIEEECSLCHVLTDFVRTRMNTPLSNQADILAKNMVSWLRLDSDWTACYSRYSSMETCFSYVE